MSNYARVALDKAVIELLVEMTDEDRDRIFDEITPRQDPEIDAKHLQFMSKFTTYSMFCSGIKNNMTHKGEDVYRSTKNSVMILHWWSLDPEQRYAYERWVTENNDKEMSNLSSVPAAVKLQTIQNYLNTPRFIRNQIFLVALLRGMNENENRMRGVDVVTSGMSTVEVDAETLESEEPMGRGRSKKHKAGK